MNKADRILCVLVGFYVLLSAGAVFLSYGVYVMVRDQQKAVSPVQKEPWKIQVEYTLPEVRK